MYITQAKINFNNLTHADLYNHLKLFQHLTQTSPLKYWTTSWVTAYLIYVDMCKVSERGVQDPLILAFSVPANPNPERVRQKMNKK